AHQLDLERRLVMRELLDFEPADAVLGADRAVEPDSDVMDDAVELLAPGEKHFGVGALGLVDVVVDVSVTDMAEGVRANAGKPLRDRVVRVLDEVRYPAHRHRDIVLDAAAFVFLRLDQAFADAPEIARLGAARGDDAVR